MSDTSADRGQVIASAARIYEEFFVPALFGQFTDRTLGAAEVRRGERLLDVACGTGVVARAAVARVGDAGRVVGLDVNEGMLAVARQAAPAVEWRPGAAEELPFDDGAFDAVTCQFALMFFADQAAALAEMARVLRPGGRLAVATWGAVEESPGYAAMVELLRRLFGEPAASALRAPFTLGDREALRQLVGPTFPDVAVTRHEGVARFESIEAWVHTDVRGWTLADLIDDAQYARLLAEARATLGQFTDEAGRVRFPAPALIASATRPDALSSR